MQTDARIRWTAAQRGEALALLAEHGPAEASRRTGIPFGTIASWGSRAGVKAPSDEKLRPALERKALSITQRKQALADTMLTEAESMIRQLRTPTVEKVVKVVSDGAREGAHTEIVEVRYDRPPTGDAKRIVESVAILVDKIQLLTGEATSRPELVAGEPAERTRALRVVEQLVERSAS